MSASNYKQVLLGLHDKVMPHFTNPLLLSDFLTESYNIGDDFFLRPEQYFSIIVPPVHTIENCLFVSLFQTQCLFSMKYNTYMSIIGNVLFTPLDIYNENGNVVSRALKVLKSKKLRMI